MAMIAPIENRIKNFFLSTFRLVFLDEKKMINATNVIRIRNQTS